MSNTAAGRGIVGNHVCVVGAGVLGLLAAKNLKEQGLEVTVIERNDYIGGLWHATLNPDQTSALPMTTFNGSRQSCAISDFPFPDSVPIFPTAKDLENYVEGYVREFNLLPLIKFKTEVLWAERDDERGKWIVRTRSLESGKEDSQSFDRLVVANGMLNKPNLPKIKGIEKFEGEAIHSRAFKDPTKYEGKRVLVVGVGATGADTVSFLTSHKAAKVYLSHRGQILLLPREVGGIAFDHALSRRMMSFILTLAAWLPRFCLSIMKTNLTAARKKAWPWLDSHPSFSEPRVMDGVGHRTPIFCHDLAENLRDGVIETVFGVREVSGPRSVTLTDGMVLENLDAIIICTGYTYDFSLVKGTGSPIDPARAPDGFKRIRATPYYNHVFPRLFHGFLSEQYPESLAFIGTTITMLPPLVLNDLVTMALGGLWSGAYPIPTASEMAADINSHYDFVVDMLGRGPVPHIGFRLQSAASTHLYLNRAARTGVPERLGAWGWEAWKLWLTDRSLYYMLEDGVPVPAVSRIFNTGRGRRPWLGAKEHIEKMNQQVRQMEAAWKKQQSLKDK